MNDPSERKTKAVAASADERLRARKTETTTTGFRVEKKTNEKRRNGQNQPIASQPFPGAGKDERYKRNER